ncbi:SDR family NAD(P)-dependent oxidoreductase [Streptomyces sp. NPDC001315]
MEGLKDKTFIVTGGGSGIGAATVLRLLSEGAQVVAGGTRHW